MVTGRPLVTREEVSPRFEVKGTFDKGEERKPPERTKFWVVRGNGGIGGESFIFREKSHNRTRRN